MADNRATVSIYGEIKNPGVFRINENTTLNDLIPEKALLLNSAARRRIEIMSKGRMLLFDLNKPSQIKLVSGDVIMVPIKSWYEEQSNEQEHTSKILVENAKRKLDEIAKIKLNGLKVQNNEGGVEFRPVKSGADNGWSRVLIKSYTDHNGSNFIVISSRNWSNRIGRTTKLKYQLELEQEILQICNTVKSSEQTVAPNR